MIKYFNENVEINLKLLIEQKNNKLFRTDFVNRLGNRLIESERFAEMMQEKGLIDIEPKKRQRCDLTEFGYEIATNGGWLKYLKDLESKKKQNLEKQDNKEKLEIELKALQKESLEHSKKIRDQESRIRNLNEELKFMSLIKQYWWFIGACIGLGYIVREFLDKS